MLDKTLYHNNSENRDKDTSETTTNSTKIYLFAFAILALVITNVYFYVKYKNSSSNVISMLSEKSQMEAELDRIELELDRVKVENQQLSDDLIAAQQEAKSKIEALRIKLTQNELTKQELVQAKAQIEELRLSVDKFKIDVDLLRRENMLLAVERDSLRNEISHVSSDMEHLKSQNSTLEAKIKSAAHLKVSAITANPVTYNRSGEERLESRAKRTDELKVNFTITDNPLAKHGNTNVYIRIIDPNGNLVLPDNSHAISSPDNEIQYSSMIEIAFNNDGKEYVYKWNNNKEKFKKGNYTIVLYHDGESMGRANVTLN